MVKYGDLWVGSGKKTWIWGSEGKFQSLVRISAAVYWAEGILAPSSQNTLGVRVQARRHNQRVGWVSEVKFEAQVKLGVRAALGFRGQG